MKFDIHLLFSPKYAQWIITSLVTLFALLIIMAFSTFLFPLTPKVASPDISKNKEKTTQSTADNYLLASSLFGVYVADDLDDDSVKKSMLDVSLVGVLLASNDQESQVIIRFANGDEHTFGVDDTIPGGALVKRIMENGVLVERNGALESLTLPRNDLLFEPIAKPLLEE